MNLPAPPLPLPHLSQVRAELTREVQVVDATGARRALRIPLERALALYVERRELVTLMTLGQEPALLALGYLLNQGLIDSAHEVHSINVDWEVGAAAVRLREGLSPSEERLARRTVTTGCGQGTVFGDWLAGIEPLPAVGGMVLEHATLVHLLEAMRAMPSVYREAGSVHGTALWLGERMLVHIEDVGRHNAVDTVAGWMAMNGLNGDALGGELVMYTTGRLTSEMVLKAVRLRVPIVVSRNGVTALGLEMAERLGLTLIGRASGQRYLCYSGAQRLVPASS